MTPEDPGWPRASDWLTAGRPRRGWLPLLVVLGAPLSQASISPSGAHETPRAVRAALRRYSTFCATAHVHLEDIDVVDAGDLELRDLPNDLAQERVALGLGPIVADLVVLLGGDNSITRPAVRGRGTPLGRMGLLTLDAHHDVRGFHAGATNGTPVRGLIDDGMPGDQITQIGIGAFTNSRMHRRYANEQGITVVTAVQARQEGVGRCVTRHLDRLAERCDEIWVDLDVDVLDAAYAPGCPGARPGGLFPWELHDAALAAGRHPKVVGVDIVEVDATADPAGLTVDQAALCLLHAAAGLAARPIQ